MDILLVKEAIYDLKTEKFTAIPGEVFSTLVDEPKNTPHPVNTYIMFDNKTDYLNNAGRHSIDFSKSVYVNPKGQIFCCLNCEEGTNAATNTEEN